jgi:hypothetical protein
VSAQIAYQDVPAPAFGAAVRAAWLALTTEGAGCSAWLEHPLRVDGIELRDGNVTPDDVAALLEEWSEGRLFGTNGELRWEDAGEHVHLVLISDTPNAIPLDYVGCLKLEPLNADPEHLLVWGQRRGDRWSEERIPMLDYPKKWRGPYAAVLARRYEHLADSTRPYDSIIVRYCGYDGAISE